MNRPANSPFVFASTPGQIVNDKLHRIGPVLGGVGNLFEAGVRRDDAIKEKS
jgi:hypothetical protein